MSGNPAWKKGSGVSANPGGRPARLKGLQAEIVKDHGLRAIKLLTDLHTMIKRGKLEPAEKLAAMRLYWDRVLGPPVPPLDEVDPSDNALHVTVGFAKPCTCQTAAQAQDSTLPVDPVG